MGEQHRLGELCLAAGDDRVDRDAGQRLQPLQRVRLEGQRHEGGPRLDQLQPEPGCDVVAESGRAHLRDRLAPAGDDQRAATHRAAGQADGEAIRGLLDAVDAGGQPEVDGGRLQLLEQHVDDLPRRAVAEQLAERLLVVANAVALDELDEVVLGMALQRRDAEMRVLRQEILRRSVDVGEVAAAATGDADLLSRRGRVVDEQHRAAPPSRLDGTHHARSTRADHKNVDQFQFVSPCQHGL
jgi:hypothetical protein